MLEPATAPLQPLPSPTADPDLVVEEQFGFFAAVPHETHRRIRCSHPSGFCDLGRLTEPSMANKPIVRLAASSQYDGAAGSNQP